MVAVGVCGCGERYGRQTESDRGPWLTRAVSADEIGGAIRVLEARRPARRRHTTADVSGGTFVLSNLDGVQVSRPGLLPALHPAGQVRIPRSSPLRQYVIVLLSPQYRPSGKSATPLRPSAASLHTTPEPMIMPPYAPPPTAVAPPLDGTGTVGPGLQTSIPASWEDGPVH